jgi:hypothetical protein
MSGEISTGPRMDVERRMVEREAYTPESDYRPNKQQLLREYEMSIRFLSIGCVIRVGCKEIPFTRVSEAMEELNKYVNNPYEESKKWNIVFDSAE